MNNWFSKLYFCLFILLGSIIFSACIDDCEFINCQNGGTCFGGFCDCPAGYSGEFCEIEGTGLCEDVQCQNGGTCIDGTCDCLDGFSGENCENVVDPCDNITCENGGTCADGACDCATGYEGDNCELEAREKFVGTYSMTDNCTGANPITKSYYLEIVDGGSGVLSITLNNLGNVYLVNAEVSGNTFSFSDEVAENNTFSGSGTLTEDYLEINFSATGGYPLDCISSGSKL